MPVKIPFVTDFINEQQGIATKKREAIAAKPINRFISEIKNGGVARHNRFAVLFTPPTGVNPDALQKVLLFCDTVQLPGVNYSTVQNRTFGEFRETPYERLYDNLAMTFYVDNDMKIKALFDDWINTVQNPNTRTFNYYNNYISNMTIEIQDLSDKTRYRMTLFECYPKNIGSIQLDAANKDVMKLQVTMQYKYFTTTPVSPAEVEVPLSFLDKLLKNFTGFQKQLNGVIGERAGNFVTGALGSAAVTKLPGLLRF
jgi:hypothetical protein